MSALSSLAFSFYSDFYQLRVPLEAGEGVHAPPRLDLKPTVGEGGASLFSCYRKLAGKSQTVTVMMLSSPEPPPFFFYDCGH